MTDDLLDLALLLEVGKSPAGERAVDLEAVDKDGDSHQAVGLDILLELVGDGLVEDDGVLGLVLDCGSKSKVSETAHMSVLVLVFFGCLCVCVGVWDDDYAAGMPCCVPLPFDHFFFCFLPPVGAGAYVLMSEIALRPRRHVGACRIVRGWRRTMLSD